MQNNKTRFFYVLYSDKTYFFHQSERAQGPIYILNCFRVHCSLLIILSTFCYIFSGAPGGPKGRPAEPHRHHGKDKDFLMVIMASDIARGRVRTTPTTTESRNMAAILQ